MEPSTNFPMTLHSELNARYNLRGIKINGYCSEERSLN